MPQLSLVSVVDSVLLILAAGILALAAYRAFASRGVLTTPSYRSWAAWTGVLAVLAIPYEANLLRVELGVPLAGQASAAFFAAVTLAGGLFGFAWIDRTISVGMNLDFFHRDALYWRRGGRYVAWALILVGVPAYAVLGFTFFENIAGAAGIVGTLGYAVAVIALSAARAHEDSILDYVRWVGLVMFAGIFASVVAGLTGYNFPQILVAFFLYRAAGSLSGSTYHFELASVIAAPRDYVYSVYTDPEKLSSITSSYRSSKVRESEAGSRDVVEVTAEILGMKVNALLSRRYLPPGGMQEEIVSNQGTGSTSFSFTEEGSGTRVEASVDFEPKGVLGKLFGGFGATQAQRQFERDFAAGKAYCESNAPGKSEEQPRRGS